MATEAEQVSLLAAPIYAEMLARATSGSTAASSDATQVEARARAISHAQALWADAGGIATPPPSTGTPIMGVTDGSEAEPGAVGEYIVASSSVGTTLPSNVPLAICQIDLTAGDWEIWGTIDFQPAAGVSPNGIAASVSLYPDALPTDADLMTGVGVLNMFTTQSLTSGQRQVLMTGTCRSNSSVPMVLFLVGQTTLGGAGVLTAEGYICARRMR